MLAGYINYKRNTKCLFVVSVLLLASQSLLNASTSNAVLIKQVTNITFRNNELISDYLYDIQINNPGADEYAKVSIPYDKLSKITSVDAYITDKHGLIIKKLRSADITKKSLITNAAFFQDAMTLEFKLQHHEFPYRIQYSYRRIQKEFLYIAKWIPVLDTGIETRQATLTLTVPENYKFSYQPQFMSGPEISTIKGTKTYIWQTTFSPLPEFEDMAPYPTTMMPVLSIVPALFRFGTAGTFESWEKYGAWQYSINSKLQQIPENEVFLIRNLISGVKDTTEMVRRIYHYLQDHTRYVNVSLETGGMIPVAASLVSSFKYGDCKGLTNYMMALLNTVGIKSHYTDIHAGEKIKPIDVHFPAQQFNHVILAVPVGGDTLWLDCTSKGPFNYAGTFIQNRPGLMIDKCGSKLVRIPALSKKQVQATRKILISKNYNELNRIEFSNTYRGESFELLSDINRYVYDKKKYFQSHFGIKNLEVDTYNPQIIHRDSLFAKLTFTATSKSCIEKVGNHLILKTIAFEVPHFAKPGSRKLPVQIDFPICKSDTQIFIIPGIQFDQTKLQNISIETEYGIYRKEFDITTNGTIAVHKYFELNAGHYSLTSYPEIYEFIRRVNEAENTAIIIKSEI